MFAADLNLIVVLMRDSSHEAADKRDSILVVAPGEIETVVKNVFDRADFSFMANVYANRSPTGEWDHIVPANGGAERAYIEQFVKVTKSNYAAALAIARVGDRVFSALFRPGATGAWIDSIRNSTGLDSILMRLSTNMFRSGMFQQLRLIMKEDVDGEKVWERKDMKCKHLTLRFGESFEYDALQLSTLAGRLTGGVFEGERFLMTFRPNSSHVPFNTSSFESSEIAGLKLEKAKDAEWFDACKTVSVVRMDALQGFCETGKTPHITERTDETNPKDSVNIIEYLSEESECGRTLSCKGTEYVFDERMDGGTWYEPLTISGIIRSQRPWRVSANYVAGTERVAYRCIGVAVFGNEDTR